MSVALDYARALDPSVMAEGIGLDPDPWQSDVFASGHPRILLNCHRQSGKSTVSSVLAVHAAVYEPRSLVLLISPSMRQSGEVFAKCMAAYTGLGRPIMANAENALSLKLENGSRIISLPGNASTVRGYSGVRLVVIDEAAYTDSDLLDALWPMLAVSHGRLIALSTPNGKRGWFWEAWESGGKSWKRVEVPVTQCKRIAPAFLEEFRLARGERKFAQEYLCQFVETTDQAFGEESIAAAFDRDLEPIRLADEDADDIDLNAKVS